MKRGGLLKKQSGSRSENPSLMRDETERQRMLAIINNITDPVLSIDSEGIITLYNAASLNLIDTNASLVGKRLDEVLSFYNENHHRVRLSAGLKGRKTTLVRDDLRLHDGEEIIRIEATITPIHTSFNSATRDNYDGFVVILRDVTRLKSLEETKDEFISVVSHELRTPITVTEGTLSNLSMMMERGFPESKLKESLRTAHEQVIFLASMVNDLSTLSRAERDVYSDPETIELNEFMHDIYNEYARRAQNKGLHLNLDAAAGLGSVTSSRLYLKELLQNFLTNAIKYTQEGSVTLHAARKASGGVYFAVSDTGIGISKNDQKKIFDKFFRSEDYRTRETRGTGLGLYVAATLAHKLGTTIEIDSRLNHGSTFSITLPDTPPGKAKTP